MSTVQGQTWYFVVSGPMMTEEGLFVPLGERGETNPSTHSSPSSIPNSGMQSDDSAFYAFGDDWDLPPPMSNTFTNFLHNKAGVPIEFVREFEQAALVLGHDIVHALVLYGYHR